MFRWFQRRQRAERLAEVEAEVLIRDHGDGAYSEARRCEREASDIDTAAEWRRVALAIARKTGKRIGLDTSTRMLE
jgi:hypothetical protein